MLILVQGSGNAMSYEIASEERDLCEGPVNRLSLSARVSRIFPQSQGVEGQGVEGQIDRSIRTAPPLE